MAILPFLSFLFLPPSPAHILLFNRKNEHGSCQKLPWAAEKDRFGIGGQQNTGPREDQQGALAAPANQFFIICKLLK